MAAAGGPIPEEAAMIANWLDEIETDVTAVLAQRGSLSARDLGRRLGVSEESAVSLIALLASSGHLVIERVSLPENARGHRPAPDWSTLIAAA
jgi:hypothetical protein